MPPCKASWTRRRRSATTEVEIIPGKGSGQLKKAVLRFLDQPEVQGALPPHRKRRRQLGPAVRPFPLGAAPGRQSRRPAARDGVLCLLLLPGRRSRRRQRRGAARGRAGGAAGRVPRLRLAEPPASPPGPARRRCRSRPSRGTTRRDAVSSDPSADRARVVATVERAEGWWAKGWGVWGGARCRPGKDCGCRAWPRCIRSACDFRWTCCSWMTSFRAVRWRPTRRRGAGWSARRGRVTRWNLGQGHWRS